MLPFILLRRRPPCIQCIDVIDPCRLEDTNDWTENDKLDSSLNPTSLSIVQLLGNPDILKEFCLPKKLRRLGDGSAVSYP